jgi:YD repeat-containing protein
VFDYNDKGLINSMLVVPEGSSDYQRWQYTYNDAGLKIKETCMNKRKQIVGRIEYVYR